MDMAISKQRILTHFTNSDGLIGITALNPDALEVGKAVTIGTIRFGFWRSTQYAREDGDIFVTELGVQASTGGLMMIGVYGDKQQFAISFDAEDAFNSGVVVSVGCFERSIFIIPAYSVIVGDIQVARRF